MSGTCSYEIIEGSVVCRHGDDVSIKGKLLARAHPYAVNCGWLKLKDEATGLNKPTILQSASKWRA